MTTKDYIYTGMIVLTALAFYCNGFYAGVYRCKKMYDALLDDTEADEPGGEESATNGKVSPAVDGQPPLLKPLRQSELPTYTRAIKGDFGRN